LEETKEVGLYWLPKKGEGAQNLLPGNFWAIYPLFSFFLGGLGIGFSPKFSLWGNL